MKQKDNLLQDLASGSKSAAGGDDSDRRGILEKLGDKILQRLAKTNAEEAGDTPRAAPKRESTQTDASNREQAISQALQNFGNSLRQAQAVPSQQAVAPSRVEEPVVASAASRAPVGVNKGVAQTGRAPSQPYVSRINRRVPAPGLPKKASAAIPSPAVSPVSARPTTPPTATTRLTPDEKSKVYQRVKSLISVAKEEKPEARTPRARGRRTLRVCFLEDSCTSSHAIREMLGEIGHEVDHFSQAEEALDAFMEKDYDLLLASQIETLGGMDCEALVRSIRANKKAAKARTPIIVLTANSDKANLQSFINAGANDVVIKPVEGRKLNERIMTAVTVQHMPRRRAKNTFSVCFLEDSCTSSHAIREMLGERGHEVDHFSSAEEALDAIMEKDYDVVLASQIVALGGMDCEGLVKTLRGSPKPKKRNLPIVVITANPDSSNVESFYLVGASDVVVKPVEGNELNQRLADVVNAQPMPNLQARAVENLRVCFLEDSCTSSHAIREMLGEAGHEVDHFSSAEETLDAVMEKDYDVLLASQIVALGGMDCEALVRTLRNSANAQKKQLPIVVITANPEPVNIKQFRAAGATDVVVKPVEGKSLSERLKKSVQAKASPQPVRALPPRVKPKHLKVCFLEDSCTSSHAIREMLGEAGHEVDHFSTAEEALDAFLEKSYDVMLASQIPTLGGLDTEGLARTIRGHKDPLKRNKALVILTTDDSQANREKFLALGANDVVVKPVKGDLSEQLREVVARGPAAAPAKRRPAQPVQVPAHLRVCFLEDSCTSSHAIREMLGEAGHEVDHFSSPEEALDALMEKKYDLLLASQIVALGGLDCAGLITTVRGAKQLEKRAIPVVAITANPDPQNLQAFRDAGADDVIVKPIEGNLSDKLKDVIRKRPPGGRQPKLKVVPGPGQAAAPAPAPAQQPPAAAPSAMQEALAKLGKAAPAPGGAAQPAPVGEKQEKSLADLLKFGQLKRPETTAPQPLAAPQLPKQRSSERKLIVIMAVLGVVGIIASTWHHFGEHTPVDVVKAEVGPIFEAINAPGRVVSRKKVELTSGVPGQIIKVFVKEGDVVRKGDVLAKMDNRNALIEVQRAEAELESAKKDVALAERTLDRLVRALQMGAVSRQMAEDAEAAVHAARARQRVAAEQLRAAQLGSERLDIAAPFDGVVTVSYAVEGLWAEPPGPLFTLVDMSQREVEVRVDAADSGEVSVGQPVLLASDAFPEHAWAEEIVRVSPAANRDGGPSNTISVYISMGPDAPPLRYGQQVDAQIRTAASANSIRVPFQAVTTRNGRTVVAVVKDERVHFQPVATGLESFTHVEILEGLQPGDEIILLNKELAEGDRVEPVEFSG